MNMQEIVNEANELNDGTPLGQMKAFLATMAGMYRKMRIDDWAFSSFEELILQLGDVHPWRPRPTFVEKGQDKECFRNALHVAQVHGWAYCEGFAYGSILPVLHAWCLDDDGYVVDPTWREREHDRHVYLGIGMDVRKVTSFVLDTGYYGVFGNDWKTQCQILQTGNLERFLPTP